MASVNLDQHILVRSISCRILHRRNHFVEQRKVVQVSLRFQQRSLVQRITGMHQYLALDNLRSRIVDSRQQHPVDENLLSFRHGQRNIGSSRICTFLVKLNVDLRLIEPVAKVVRQHRVPVA